MEKLLTPEQVAEITNIKPGALAGLRYTGKGPKFLKPTKRTVLYRESDVWAWLNASERTITGAVA